MNFISENIEEYCLSKSNLSSNLCNALEEHTWKTVPMPQMLSGPMVASFLGFLIKACSVNTILEIGTYTGYSSLCMAENLPPNGTIDTIDIEKTYVDNAQKYWNDSPHGNKIISHIGPALEIVPNLNKKFDLVFIDADKVNYLNYLKMILDDDFLSSKGIIVLDNCLWSGKVLLTGGDDSTLGIQNVNNYIASREDLYKCLIPIRDGLFLVTRNKQFSL